MSEVKKTITAVTKATGALSKISIELQKQMSALGGFSETVHILAEDIEFKQQELAGIEQSISDAERKAKAELELRILENQDSVVSALLGNRGCVAIGAGELDELRSSLTEAKQQNQNAIDEAAAAQKSKSDAALRAAVDKVKSDNAVATAEATARITMLQQQLSDARMQNDELKEMLNQERAARVAIAKAGTNINVTAPNK